MANNDKPEEEMRQVPIVEEDFATLLGKFRIKPEVAKNIADNISHIGGGTVFENPGLLTKKLAAWSTEISPAKRRLVIEQWFAERGIDVPEEVIEKAGKGPDQLKKEAKGKEEAENIYFVEPDTGILRLAIGNERATTLSEAMKLQKLIKKDLAQQKREEKESGEGAKEPAFILGEGGTWTLNPKSRIGFGEFAVFQMYQDSLKKGEPIDPVEELTKREEQSIRLKEAMGVKSKDEDTELTLLDKLDRLGMLKKTEGGGTLEMLQVLGELGVIKKTGEEGRTSELDLIAKLGDLGFLRKPGEERGTSELDLIARLGELGFLRKPGEERGTSELDLIVKLSELGVIKKAGEEGRSSELEMIAKLSELGVIKKAGEEGRTSELDLMAKLSDLGFLKKPGEGEGATTQTMHALEAQVKELTDSLRKQELDTVKSAMVSLSNQMGELRKGIENQGKLEGRYALMDKSITTLDNQLTGLRSDARPVLEAFARGGGGPEPKIRTPEEKAKVAKGLKEATALERRARELEDKLLFGVRES